MSAAKAVIRRWFDRFGSRERISDWPVYRLYVAVFYPKHARIKKAEHDFYRALVGPERAPRIFDIGANVGSKTAIFASLAEQVVAVEPGTAAAKILYERFGRKRNVTIVRKGVGATEATALLHQFDGAEACNTMSSKQARAVDRDAAGMRSDAVVEVSITTLDDLIAEYGIPAYIKIDVEGFELEVLKGLSTRVPMLSIEANLPSFAPETVDAVLLLGQRFAGCEFNFCTEEPPQRFESERWLSDSEMMAAVGSNRWTYVEIYCRSRP